jgi:hypothetical protein
LRIRQAAARILISTALAIVVDTAQAYCQQYVHQMANGATVVGPNH